MTLPLQQNNQKSMTDLVPFCLQSVSRSVMSDSLQPHMDYSPPGSSVNGILQARILEWGRHSLLQGIFMTQGLNHVSCIAGIFFTVWTTWKALYVCVCVWRGAVWLAILQNILLYRAPNLSDLLDQGKARPYLRPHACLASPSPSL